MRFHCWLSPSTSWIPTNPCASLSPTSCDCVSVARCCEIGKSQTNPLPTTPMPWPGGGTLASWQFKPKCRWQPDGPWLRRSLSLSLSMCVCVWEKAIIRLKALTSDKVIGRVDGCCCCCCLLGHSESAMKLIRWLISAGQAADVATEYSVYVLVHCCHTVACLLPALCHGLFSLINMRHSQAAH